MEVIEETGPYQLRIADDEAERMRIWKGRKSAFSAAGRLSPDYLVNDGVVPRSRLGEALVEIQRLGGKYGLPIANVFHAGDGNLHPLILYDGRQSGALRKAEKLAGEILEVCIRFGGSITGEHGIGREKRDYLRLMFSAADIATMKAIHQQIDPANLANRGKMFPN